MGAAVASVRESGSCGSGHCCGSGGKYGRRAPAGVGAAVTSVRECGSCGNGHCCGSGREIQKKGSCGSRHCCGSGGKYGRRAPAGVGGAVASVRECGSCGRGMLMLGAAPGAIAEEERGRQGMAGIVACAISRGGLTLELDGGASGMSLTLDT
ncbi:hypothetical protein ROHU_021884 [Labeo rohita]|uniref:Uncharacterized protein n=1 Tax=Labeo rohita TaxID=84645 RepID=A0A498MWT7_LABRO|nr:hypothetical protein ROHU_021884 [Labeo rohita]